MAKILHSSIITLSISMGLVALWLYLLGDPIAIVIREPQTMLNLLFSPFTSLFDNAITFTILMFTGFTTGLVAQKGKDAFLGSLVVFIGMLVGYLWCSLDSLLHVTTVSELVLTSSFQYNLLTLFLLIVALPSIVGKLTQTKETVPTKEDILQHQIRNQKERLNIPEDLPTLEKRFITKIKEKVAHHGVVNVKEEFPHVSNASLNEVMMKLRVNARFEVPNDAYYVYTPDFKQDLLQRIKLLLKHNIKNTADMAQILGIGTDTVTYFMQQSNIHF